MADYFTVGPNESQTLMLDKDFSIVFRKILQLSIHATNYIYTPTPSSVIMIATY